MRAVSCGVVFWSVLTGALMAPRQVHAEQELPVYPGVLHTWMGIDLVIGGELFRLAYFTTPDSLKKVGAYFAREWATRGYPVTVDGDFRQGGVVSAFFNREGLVRSVVLRS